MLADFFKIVETAVELLDNGADSEKNQRNYKTLGIRPNGGMSE